MASDRAQKAAIQALVKQLEPSIAKSFSDAVYSARGRVNIAELIAAMQSGDLAAAQNMLTMTDADFAPVKEAIRGAYVQSGQSAAAILPRGIAAKWGFDSFDPRAVAFITEHGAALVQGIIADTQEATQAVLTRALTEQRSLREAALDIVGRLNTRTGKREGGILGLTSQMTDEITNARAILSDPNRLREYLVKDQVTGRWKTKYARADQRFKNVVVKAINEGRGLTKAEIERGLELHKNKLLKVRGQMIARNEAFTAQATGRDLAMQQIKERPDIETVTVRWQHNLSQNPRDDHVAMDGTVIDLGQTFNFPDAQMKHPHDPAGGASHSIGCRCIAVYRARAKR